MSPQFKFVDQLEDIKNSINYIKKKYGNDIKIVISGHSAGAHLAYYASKEIEVNGLILSSGVYDLTTYTQKYVDQIIDSKFSAKSISPIFDTYKLDISVLLTYSSDEEKIYITQSEDFYNKIKNNNKILVFCDHLPGTTFIDFLLILCLFWNGNHWKTPKGHPKSMFAL